MIGFFSPFQYFEIFILHSIHYFRIFGATFNPLFLNFALCHTICTLIPYTHGLRTQLVEGGSEYSLKLRANHDYTCTFLTYSTLKAIMPSFTNCLEARSAPQPNSFDFKRISTTECCTAFRPSNVNAHPIVCQLKIVNLIISMTESMLDVNKIPKTRMDQPF